MQGTGGGPGPVAHLRTLAEAPEFVRQPGNSTPIPPTLSPVSRGNADEAGFLPVSPDACDSLNQNGSLTIVLPKKC